MMKKKIASMALALSMVAGMFSFTSITASATEPAADDTLAMRYTDTAIVIDGVVDDAWKNASATAMVNSIGGSETTATIKTLYADVGPRGSAKDKTLYVLVEADKHGVAVTGDEIVTIGFNSVPNQTEWAASNTYHYGGFGIGTFNIQVGTRRDQEKTVDNFEDDTSVVGSGNSGFIACFYYSEWIAEAKKTTDTTFVAEFAIPIVDANTEWSDSRQYETSADAKDGFGEGTVLGLNAIIEEDGSSTLTKAGVALRGINYYEFREQYVRLVATTDTISNGYITTYGHDVTVDGEIDPAWAFADERATYAVGTSKTTAKVKTLYGATGEGEDYEATLYILVEIDKHGTAVTDTDTAWVGINLLCNGYDCRNGDVFGTAAFGASADGTATTAYGWFGRYANDSLKAASKKIADDKWVAEYSVSLIGAEGGRAYVHGEESGFGIGTGIGIAVAVQDECADLVPETGYTGTTWGGSTLSEFVYTYNRAVIGEDVGFGTFIAEGNDQKYKQADSTVISYTFANRDNAVLKDVLVDDQVVPADKYTYEGGRVTLTNDYLIELTAKESHVIKFQFTNGACYTSLTTDALIVNKTIKASLTTKALNFNPLIKASEWDACDENKLTYYTGDVDENIDVTFKVMWYRGINAQDGSVYCYLYILTTVDKNGTAINDNDTIYIGMDPIANQNTEGWGGDIRAENKFDVGQEIITAAGTSTRSGWRSVYARVAGSSKSVVKKTATDTMQIMTFFEICQTDATNRPWQHLTASGTFEDGFDFGTTIGFDVVYGNKAYGDLDTNCIIWGTDTYAKSVKTKYMGRLTLCDENGLISGEIPEITTVYGDVNGDGKIKGNDATLLLKYLAEWDVDINEANADVNGDSKIKGNDATLLLKYLAEWNVTLGPSK